MTLFQILGIIVSFAFVLLSLASLIRGRVHWGASFSWMLLWLLSAVAFMRPEWTTTVASWLGIHRGADFVFYCSILAMLVGFFVVFARLRRIEANVTDLVRQIALGEAPNKSDEPRRERDRP